jgi:periplasmic protein TorT
MKARVLLIGALLAWGAASAQDYSVEAYYGSYDVSTKEAGRPATSLRGPETLTWTSPEPAGSYTIGVSFPHLKDPYWLAVNYGVIDQARRLGVGIDLVAAQGYDDLTGQINQVENLANRGVDGIILAAISYSAQDQLVEQLAEQLPVVEVINDIQAARISAKALVSFFTMGYQAGRFVAEDAQDEVTVAFLPGPAGSGWAPDTLAGFEQALADAGAAERVEIVSVQYGDTGKGTQVSLIENVLNTYPDLDYLVGNAVAADAAPDVLANRSERPKIVSTYIIPPLYQKIADGQVAAAPTDFTALQGRMAVDMMVRILNGETPGEDFPFRAGPVIQVVTPENYQDFSYEDMFGPEDWRPVFTLEAGGQ